MPRAKVVHTAAYEAALEQVSDRMLDAVESVECNLATFPDMGSPLVRPSLVRRYGPDLRKLVVRGWLLVYRHDEDIVRMLALVPGKTNV